MRKNSLYIIGIVLLLSFVVGAWFLPIVPAQAYVMQNGIATTHTTTIFYTGEHSAKLLIYRLEGVWKPSQ